MDIVTIDKQDVIEATTSRLERLIRFREAELSFYLAGDRCVVVEPTMIHVNDPDSLKGVPYSMGFKDARWPDKAMIRHFFWIKEGV
ncbi:MAG: hypothetical protein ABEN55_03755 [Bradymonadaceae bacterium]